MDKIAPIVKTIASDKHEITLHIPNVRYAKEHGLLIKRSLYTHEILLENMTTCGFNVISGGKFKGVKTVITVKCCAKGCDETSERQYSILISQERLPLCKSCLTITRSINGANQHKIVAFNEDKRIIFHSNAEAGRHLNLTPQTVYNYVKRGTTHSSGWRFEFLD